MVHDISEKLPPRARDARRPRVSTAMRARLTAHVPRAVRALVPTAVLALAAGMFGWLVATAAAALNLAPAEPGALVVGFRVARWTFVAGVAVALFRFGVELEWRRWRRQPSAA